MNVGEIKYTNFVYFSTFQDLDIKHDFSENVDVKIFHTFMGTL